MGMRSPFFGIALDLIDFRAGLDSEQQPSKDFQRMLMLEGQSTCHRGLIYEGSIIDCFR
jgi:hypothetical protein